MYQQQQPENRSPDQSRVESPNSHSAAVLYPLSSGEDVSWSIVSTPSSSLSTPCVTGNGSQSNPDALKIEELNEEEEEILASNIDEQTDIGTRVNDGLSHSIGKTPPIPMSATSNPYSSSFLFSQHLLVNRSSTIKSLSRFAEDSTRSSSFDKPIILPLRDQAFQLSADMRNQRESSDKVSVVSRSEAVSITDTGSFKRDDQVTRLQITEYNQASPVPLQQTSTAQFVSAYSHIPSSATPFTSSHVPVAQHNPPYFPAPQIHPQITERRPPSTCLIPVKQEQQPHAYCGSSTSLVQREPNISQFGRGGSYDAPNQHRDYALANAAYTKAMSDAARLQMMAFASRTPQQPIIIQNTTKAVAESQNESKTITQPPPSKRSAFEHWVELLYNFWSSKLNRFLLIGLTGAGLYLYWEWSQHYRRMQLMQRRIEANPLLRLGQIISGVADGQRSRTYNSGGSY